MKINRTPISTCQNYLINDFEIDDDLIPACIHPFPQVKHADNSGEKARNGLINIPSNYTSTIDVKDGDNINLDYSFGENSDHLVEYIKFNVKSNSRCNINVCFSSCTRFFHNGSFEFIVGEDSHVSAVFISDLMYSNSLDLLSITSTLGKNSTLDICVIDLTENLTASRRLNVNLLSSDSDVNIRTIYLANGGRIDYNYIVDVVGEKCNVDMQCVGAISSCDKHFKGSIDFKKGCRGSSGREREECLLIDDDSHSLSLPVILCGEENVDASHATSNSKLSDKALFYMNSRGIDDRSARKMYLASRLSSLMMDLDEMVKEKVLNKIDRLMYEK